MDKGHLSGDLLCDYAEGQLAPAAHREAEGHLQGCAGCRRELEALRGYFQEMAGLDTLKAPDRFLTKVHGRIAKASPWKRALALLSSPRLLPVPIAALSVIVLGVYLAFMSRDIQEAAQVASAPVPAAPTMQADKEERVATIPPPGAASRTLSKASRPTEAAQTGRKARRSEVEKSGGESERMAMQAKPTLDTKKELAAVSRKQASANDHVAVDPSYSYKGKTGALEIAQAEADRDAAPGSAALGAASGKSIASKSKSRVDGSLNEDLAKEGRAAPAPSAAASKPWPPLAYTLKLSSGRNADSLRMGLIPLGIRVIRQEEGPGERYELSVPALQVEKLETHLRGFGTLAPSSEPLPGGKDGAPIPMTLRILRGR